HRIEPMPDGANPTELVNQIEIPRKAGSVTQRNLPTNEPVGVVVCLQDLPAARSVQYNHARIIERLVKRYGFRYVFVEGASGPGDFSTFEEMPLVIVKAFSSSLFRKAYLTVTELLSMTRPEVECVVWG